MTGKIYLLRNPIDGTVFYIGQTIYSLSERLRGHLSEKSGHTKNNIITDLLSQSLCPVIEELESVEYNTSGINLLNERELFWINHYSPIGNRLHILVHIKNCLCCGLQFEAKTKRALYCSDICRSIKSKEKRKAVVPQKNETGVFAKRTNCLYCDKVLDAKYRSKKFCDDKCRIYWNRENTKVKIADLTTPANKVEPKKSLGAKKTNVTINTVTEPKEGSGAFFLKYGVGTWAEVNNKK